MTKMTYAVALSHVLANCELPEDVREKLVTLNESLAKKASAEKKPTAKQKENSELAEQVLTYLRECGQPKTVSDLLAECECVKGMSNQKVSALLRGMLGSSVERVEDKRKAYFKALV